MLIHLNQNNIQLFDLYNHSVCDCKTHADSTLPALPMTLFINDLLSNFRKVCYQTAHGQFHTQKNQFSQMPLGQF